jgi:hypothetical protein
MATELKIFEVPGTEAWGRRIRAEAQELATRIDETYLDLAERLYLIWDTPKDGDKNNPSICSYWTGKDGKRYASFDAYVGEELKIHPKKAQRLKRVWYKLGIELAALDPAIRQRFSRLGFSKARELVSVLTLKNAEKWLEKAETSTYLQLSKTVEAYRAERDLRRAQRQQEAQVNGTLAISTPSGLPSSPISPAPKRDDDDEEDVLKIDSKLAQLKSDIVMKSFGLYPDQVESVELALRRAAELSHSSKKSHNLSLICLDFIATNTFSVANEEMRLRFLQKFETLLGFKLVVIDPLSKEVVYGIETLENLASAHSEED